MKFIIQNLKKDNVYNLMRGTGYHFLGKGNEDSESVFVKALERGGYPRFHLYLKTEGDKLALSLHLDQKRPVYKGATAHSGEYEGEILEEEAQFLKEKLTE